MQIGFDTHKRRQKHLDTSFSDAGKWCHLEEPLTGPRLLTISHDMNLIANHYYMGLWQPTKLMMTAGF